VERISRMAEWPDWNPPETMIDRQPYLPRFTAGGEPRSPRGMKTKNSGFEERRTHNVSQRSEPSRTATAYRCSSGTSGRSFIRPTLGIAAAPSLTSSKMLRQFSNSSRVGRRCVNGLRLEPSLECVQIVLADELPHFISPLSIRAWPPRCSLRDHIRRARRRSGLLGDDFEAMTGL
jgi:hypothetical protein